MTVNSGELELTTTNEIIQIKVDSSNQAVSRQAQSVSMILAKHTAFTELAREYSSLDGVGEDFAITSTVYKMANSIFSQAITPSRLVIGRGQVDSATVSIGTLSNSTTYKLTVNGSDYVFVSDTDATATEIIAGLKADYDADPISGITFVNNADGTGTFSVATAGTAWSLSSSANLSVAAVAPSTPATSYVADLDAVNDYNGDWYVLLCESHNSAVQEALAAAIQAMPQKVYFTSTQDATAVTSATTDIGAKLKALGYDSTSVIYLTNADTQYPECAFTRWGQNVAGSTDFCYKELIGVTTDKLSTNKSNILHGKNYTTYETMDNLNRTVGGDMASGKGIDSKFLEDWWIINVRADLWQFMGNVNKIAYRDAPARVEAVIRSVNARGIANGGISATPAPTISIPDITTISTTDRINRHLPNVRCRWTDARSMRTVEIILGIDV